MISVNWWDAETDQEMQEVDGWYFPNLDGRPMVGDSIHYWQDGTDEVAGGEGLNRRDYVVTKVEHDLRFMPGRRGGSPNYVHSFNVYLRRAAP